MVCLFCMWFFLSSFDLFSVYCCSSVIQADKAFLGSVLVSIDANSVSTLFLMRLTSSRSLVSVCLGNVQDLFCFNVSVYLTLISIAEWPLHLELDPILFSAKRSPSVGIICLMLVMVGLSFSVIFLDTYILSSLLKRV